jgi:hypothetical protein
MVSNDSAVAAAAAAAAAAARATDDPATPSLTGPAAAAASSSTLDRRSLVSTDSAEESPSRTLREDAEDDNGDEDGEDQSPPELQLVNELLLLLGHAPVQTEEEGRAAFQEVVGPTHSDSETVGLVLNAVAQRLGYENGDRPTLLYSPPHGVRQCVCV